MYNVVGLENNAFVNMDKKNNIPFFSSWNRWYFFVILVLVILIIFFALITKYFS